MTICIPCRSQPHLPEVCAEPQGCFCQHKMDSRRWGWADGIGFYDLQQNLANARMHEERNRGAEKAYGVTPVARYRRVIPLDSVDVPLPDEDTADRSSAAEHRPQQ